MTHEENVNYVRRAAVPLSDDNADAVDYVCDMADWALKLFLLAREVNADAERYRFCRAHGFPVRNQTPHAPDWYWLTADGTYHGATPTLCIDSARAALAAIVTGD